MSRRRGATSLSPAKKRLPPPNNKQQAKTVKTPEKAPIASKPHVLPRHSVAISQEESLLLSSAGDVLVCRSREFAQLFGMGGKALEQNSLRWCDAECAELALENSAICNPWLLPAPKTEPTRTQTTFNRSPTTAGLRGGSTYEWNTRDGHRFEPPNLNGDAEMGTLCGSNADIRARNISNFDQRHLGNESQMSTTSEEALDPDENFLSMPSFDYSHFGNDGNDMVATSPDRMSTRRMTPADDETSEKLFDSNKKLSETELQSNATSQTNLETEVPKQKKISSQPEQYMHGVPTFLLCLSQIRITQVSAHPRGSHVLLISSQALLLAYGLNDHGQLGIGMKSPVTDPTRFLWTPTIITPLLENGGKAVSCAAGESHSLVVVATEGRRVVKTNIDRHDKDKQGVLGSIEMNRVISSPSALRMDLDDTDNSSSSRTFQSDSVVHHQVYGFGRNNFMKIGLVHPKLAKNSDSEDEMDDILLPHRVALHCTIWPDKQSQEVQSPPLGVFAISASSEHSAALVHRATGEIELYTWGNAAAGALGLSSHFVCGETLGSGKVGFGLHQGKVVPVPTFVEYLSYSPKGLRETSALKEDSEYPIDLALGPTSTFVLTSLGRCLSFGTSYDGMLGQGRGITESFECVDIKFPAEIPRLIVSSISAGTGHVLALTKDGTVYAWGKKSDGRLGQGAESIDDEGVEWLPVQLSFSNKEDTGPINEVCAGLDCSIFVATSGKVFSCGKSSGRLGLGESSSDVMFPTPLFGGLRLWQRPPGRHLSHKKMKEKDMEHLPATSLPRPFLKRGLTLG